MLTTVSGVGPKAAISILSQFTPEQFIFAVCAEDKKAISKANGIGPKIAARIILELHDKLAAGGAMPDLGGNALPQINLPSTAAAPSHLRDAQEALLVLGYNRTEVLAALQGLDSAQMTLTFERYEEVPKASQAKIIEEAKNDEE